MPADDSACPTPSPIIAAAVAVIAAYDSGAVEGPAHTLEPLRQALEAAGVQIPEPDWG